MDDRDTRQRAAPRVEEARQSSVAGRLNHNLMRAEAGGQPAERPARPLQVRVGPGFEVAHHQTMAHLEPGAPAFEIHDATAVKGLVAIEIRLPVGRGESLAEQRILERVIDGRSGGQRALSVRGVGPARGRRLLGDAFDPWRDDRPSVFDEITDVAIVEMAEEPAVGLTVGLWEREEKGDAGLTAVFLGHPSKCREQAAAPMRRTRADIHELRRHFDTVAEANRPRQHAEGTRRDAVREGHARTALHTAELASVFSDEPVEVEVVTTKRFDEERHQRRHLSAMDDPELVRRPASLVRRESFTPEHRILAEARRMFAGRRTTHDSGILAQPAEAVNDEGRLVE